MGRLAVASRRRRALQARGPDAASRGLPDSPRRSPRADGGDRVGRFPRRRRRIADRPRDRRAHGGAERRAAALGVSVCRRPHATGPWPLRRRRGDRSRYRRRGGGVARPGRRRLRARAPPSMPEARHAERARRRALAALVLPPGAGRSEPAPARRARVVHLGGTPRVDGPRLRRAAGDAAPAAGRGVATLPAHGAQPRRRPPRVRRARWRGGVAVRLGGRAAAHGVGTRRAPSRRAVGVGTAAPSAPLARRPSQPRPYRSGDDGGGALDGEPPRLSVGGGARRPAPLGEGVPGARADEAAARRVARTVGAARPAGDGGDPAAPRPRGRRPDALADRGARRRARRRGGGGRVPRPRRGGARGPAGGDRRPPRRGQRAGAGARRARRDASPVSIARARLAQDDGGPRPRRLSRRRHGPRQDHPAHRVPPAAPGRAAGGPPPLAGRVPHLGPRQLGARAGAVRAVAPRRAPPRRRALSRARGVSRLASRRRRPHHVRAPPARRRACSPRSNGPPPCWTRPRTSRTRHPPRRRPRGASPPAIASPSPARPSRTGWPSCGRSWRSRSPG